MGILKCDVARKFLGSSWSENSSLSVKVTLLNHRGSFRRNSHGGVREKPAFRYPGHRRHPVRSVETKLFQTGHSLVWVRRLDIKTTQPHQTHPFLCYTSVLSLCNMERMANNISAICFSSNNTCRIYVFTNL